MVEWLSLVLAFGAAGAARAQSLISLERQVSFGQQYVYMSSPLIVDVRPDVPGKEILVGSFDGWLYCFSASLAPLWQFDAGAAIDSSPAAADIDNDGQIEIVCGVGSYMPETIRPGHGGVMVLDPYGALIWRYRGDPIPPIGEFGGPGLSFTLPLDRIGPGGQTNPDGRADAVIAAPALANIDDDPELEILFGSLDHNFYALNHDGTLVENYVDDDGDGRVNEDPGWERPASGGRDDDGDARQSCNTCTGNCLDEDPPDWVIHNQDTVMGSPAVGDVDGDGVDEVVFGGDSTGSPSSYCPDGGKLWILEPGGLGARRNLTPLPGGCVPLPEGSVRCSDAQFYSSPALADVNGDGRMEIFIGSGDYPPYYDHAGTRQLHAFDGNGYYLPNYPHTVEAPYGAFIRSSPAIGDVNGDGAPDVAFVVAWPVGNNSRLHVIDAGSAAPLPGFPVELAIPNGSGADTPVCISSPLVVDADGNGVQDVLVGAHNHVFGFADGGRVLFKFQVPSFMPIQNSLAADDVDDDGKIEIVVAAGDVSQPVKGGLFVCEAGAFDASAQSWPMLRGGPERRGVYQAFRGPWWEVSGWTAPGAQMTFADHTGGVLMTVTAGTDGYYACDRVPDGWSGTITPYRTGHGFEPPYRVIDDVVQNVTDQNFDFTIDAVSISGHTAPFTRIDFVDIYGFPLSSVTADINGDFIHNQVPRGWSGAMTPVKQGYAFDPPTRDVIYVTDPLGGQDFIPVIDAVHITGWTGPGTSIDFVSLQGELTATTIADGTGFYDCGQIPRGWSGRIAPRLDGHVFVPPYRDVANVDPGLDGQNFEAQRNFHIIEGRAAPGATLTFQTLGGDVLATVLASPDGSYRCDAVPRGWTGRVTPQRTAYTFWPLYRDYADVAMDYAGEDYDGSPVLFTISGWTNAPGAIVLFKPETSLLSRTVSADGNGYYECADVPLGWSGKIVPIQAGNSFSPSFLRVRDLQQSLGNQNFDVTGGALTVSGASAPGVEVRFLNSDGSLLGTVETELTGAYTCSQVPYGWSGSVVPDPLWRSFTPPSREYANLTVSRSAQDFDAIPETPETDRDDCFSGGCGDWLFYGGSDPFTPPTPDDSQGGLRIITNDNRANFGFWTVVDAAPVQTDVLYRARWTVSTDIAVPAMTPAFRLRVNACDYKQANALTIESNGDGACSPDADGEVYDLYFESPVGSPEADWGLSFDMMNFGGADAAAGHVSLDHVTLARLSLPPVCQTAMTYRFGGGDGSWLASGSIPGFTAPRFTMSDNEIGLIARDNTNLFGFWSSPSDDILFDNVRRIYRARFSVRADEADRGRLPSLRLRMNVSNFQSSVLTRADSACDGANSPGLDYRDYALYYVSAYSDAGAGMMLSFDMINFDPTDSATAGFFLNEVEIDCLPLPPL